MAKEREDPVEHMSHTLPARSRPDPAAAPFLREQLQLASTAREDTQADGLISSYAALTRDLDGLCRGRLGAGVGIRSLDRPQLQLGAAQGVANAPQSRRGPSGTAGHSFRQHGEDFLRGDDFLVSLRPPEAT